MSSNQSQDLRSVLQKAGVPFTLEAGKTQTRGYLSCGSSDLDEVSARFLRNIVVPNVKLPGYPELMTARHLGDFWGSDWSDPQKADPLGDFRNLIRMTQDSNFRFDHQATAYVNSTSFEQLCGCLLPGFCKRGERYLLGAINQMFATQNLPVIEVGHGVNMDLNPHVTFWIPENTVVIVGRSEVLPTVLVNKAHDHYYVRNYLIYPSVVRLWTNGNRERG